MHPSYPPRPTSPRPQTPPPLHPLLHLFTGPHFSSHLHFPPTCSNLSSPFHPQAWSTTIRPKSLPHRMRAGAGGGGTSLDLSSVSLSFPIFWRVDEQKEFTSRGGLQSSCKWDASELVLGRGGEKCKRKDGMPQSEDLGSERKKLRTGPGSVWQAGSRPARIGPVMTL